MIEKSPSEVFKIYREYLGMKSQSQLAKLMDSTPATISRWESEKVRIPGIASAHVKALVEGKLRDSILEAFAKVKPRLAISDFRKLLGRPKAELADDKRGRLYVGCIEVLTHRGHTLHFSVKDKRWFTIAGDGSRGELDSAFLQRILRPKGGKQ